MRAVSFVDKLYFDVKGNIMKNAIALGDVDNDNANELVVGNIHGDMYIFKGSERKPWKTASGLGMVAVVLVGDAMNNKTNCIITFSGEGLCYIFDIPDSDVEIASCDHSKRIKHYHQQRLPANAKVALLGDIDGDGNNEIVIGLTDRVVRSYRWVDNMDGTFVPLNKWEFANQIGNVSLHMNADDSRCLLVSQPGGTYVRLQCSNLLEMQADDDDDAMSQCLDYHPLMSAKMRNLNITTEILGNVSRKSEDDAAPFFVVSTLDGTLMLVEEDKIVWSLQVDHQLFGLSKMDITGDGREEIIVSSWDGQTYIIDHERQSVRFQFPESVCAFVTGSYSIDGCSDVNVSCLAFVTFSDTVVLYYNVELSQIVTSCLIDAMIMRPKVQELLEKLNVDEEDFNQLKQLNRWCLYEQPKQNGES